MQNDPELNPKFLGQISADFVKVADQLKEASYQIRKRGFSDYPIFPIAKIGIQVGTLLYDRGAFENDFEYYASFMEEFLERNLIEDEENFKQVYKNSDEFCCLFVVDEDFTNFLFIPYPTD